MNLTANWWLRAMNQIDSSDPMSKEVHITLGDCLERISNGVSATQHKERPGLPVSRIETISDGSINLEKVRFVRDLDAQKIAHYSLKKGDILFSHINSDRHLGKVALFDSSETLIHGINLLLLRFCKSCDPKFAFFKLKFLRHSGFFESIAQHAVNQSSINQKKLKSVPFPLPPLDEQKRIVGKIEELFCEIDAGEQSLRAARSKLTLYRQSLLKQAFEGKLTEAWRTANPDKLEDPETLLTRIQQERETRHQQQLQDWQQAVEE